MIDHSAIHLALRARLLTVSGIPDANHRAWENKSYTPVDGEPYIEEQFVPAVQFLWTMPPQGAVVEARGLYVVNWFGVSNTGTNGISTGCDAILAKFTPGTRLVLASGDIVRIRSDPAPARGQILPLEAGWASCTVNIPYWCLSTNTVLA